MCTYHNHLWWFEDQTFAGSSCTSWSSLPKTENKHCYNKCFEVHTGSIVSDSLAFSTKHWKVENHAKLVIKTRVSHIRWTTTHMAFSSTYSWYCNKATAPMGISPCMIFKLKVRGRCDLELVGSTLMCLQRVSKQHWLFLRNNNVFETIFGNKSFSRSLLVWGPTVGVENLSSACTVSDQ